MSVRAVRLRRVSRLVRRLLVTVLVITTCAMLSTTTLYALAPVPGAAELAAEGLRYVASREWGAANERFSRALQTDPDFGMAYLLRANVALLQNQPLRAIDDLTVYIQVWPGDASVHYLRAHVYVSMRAFDAAIADYEEVLWLAPAHLQAPGIRLTIVLLALARRFET